MNAIKVVQTPIYFIYIYIYIYIFNPTLKSTQNHKKRKKKEKKKTPYPLSSLTFPPPSLQNLYDLLWTELKKGLCAAIFKVT